MLTVATSGGQIYVVRRVGCPDPVLVEVVVGKILSVVVRGHVVDVDGVALLEVVEKERVVGHVEDELLHLLRQTVQVVGVLRVPNRPEAVIGVLFTGWLSTSWTIFCCIDIECSAGLWADTATDPAAQLDKRNLIVTVEVYEELNLPVAVVCSVCKLRSANLLSGLRVSRAFLLLGTGGRTRKCKKIRETLGTEWLDSVYSTHLDAKDPVRREWNRMMVSSRSQMNTRSTFGCSGSGL